MVYPQIIAQAVKGKLLSSVTNFVATFNFVAKFVCKLTATNGLSLTGLNVDKPKIGLVGFESATEGQIPSKTGSSIKWLDASDGKSIKFIGTDNSYAIVGDTTSTDYKTVTFASPNTANTVVTVSGSDGNAVITIGAYYR